jgi:steroid delta-isomerase-like uncharacterized protein
MTTTTAKSAEQNEECLRRLYDEALSGGDMNVVDEICADDFALHTPSSPEPIRGPEGFKRYVGTYRDAFPDVELVVEDIITEADTAALRGTLTGTHDGELVGIPPTGLEVSVMGMTIVRFENGKVVEMWSISDTLGLLQQLGVAPDQSTGAEHTG